MLSQPLRRWVAIGARPGFKQNCVMMEVEGGRMKLPPFWLMVLLLVAVGCVAEQPNASLYNEKADARQDIAAAVANAEGSRRNIVLIFGANW